MTVTGFESFGVPVRITLDTVEASERLAEVLPPGHTELAAEARAEEFALLREGPGTYTFTRGGSPVSSDVDLEFGITMLQTQVRLFIGLHAADRVFVHAGAVGIGGRAVIFPGRSFSGKTQLTASFLRAGATYLSDEFAVLDAGGNVHPFPSRLSLRLGEEQRQNVDPADLGAHTAESSLPLGGIVVTGYRPGAKWAPQELTRGRAALALLDNSIAALTRHSEAMPIFRQVTDGPLLLTGERGEAEAVVVDLMSRFEPAPPALNR